MDGPTGTTEFPETPKGMNGPAGPLTKGKAIPLVRTKKQQQAVAEAALGAEQAEVAEQAQTETAAAAARLAQIVNLHIAGFSLSAIGAQIGATPDEVDRMLSTDAARYVRSQPQLRVYVRNFLSEKYTALLDTVWDRATDADHRENLEAQDRAMRVLKEMGNLHGAAAPTQTEVKVEAAPDAVEKLVSALAESQGLGYDVNIFDVVPGEVVHAAPKDALAALERASDAVGQHQPEDEEELHA